MELTKVEKEIINAYKNGADINIGYHTATAALNINEAIEELQKFGGVSRFVDLEKVKSISVQNNKHERLQVSVFIDYENDKYKETKQ